MWVSAAFQTHVPNNTALRASAATVGAIYVRDGFATAGDGGAAVYKGSTSACSLNAGAGDNGSQVQAAGGGCWNIDPIQSPLNPFIFGAVGDASTDDAPEFQAMFDAAQRLNVNVTVGKAPNKWKWNSGIVVDYTSTAINNFMIAMDGASIDAQAVTTGQPFLIRCGATTTQDSKQCQGLYVRGMWRLNCNIADYCFYLGKSDLSDVNQGVVIESAIVQNQSRSPAAGGCQLNFPTTDNLTLQCNVNGGGGINAHGPAKAIQIVGASMSKLTLHGNVGGCLFSGNCDNLSLSSRADIIGFADAMYAPGLTQQPPSVSNVLIGGDLEVSPVCVGVTAVNFFGNQGTSPFASCFRSYQTSLPTVYQVAGTVTAGNVFTLTASNAAGTPSVSVTTVSGDTNKTTVQKLAQAVNASTAMQAAGLYGTVSVNDVAGVYMVVLAPSSAAILDGNVVWTNSVSGTQTLTVVNPVVGGNLINNPMLQGQPSWRVGNMGGWEIVGQGATTHYHAPYGSTYTVAGNDANATMSSYFAGAIGPQVVTTFAADAAFGATSVTVADATGIQVTDKVAAIGIQCVAVVTGISGNVVTFSGCAISATGGVRAGIPIAFTPPDAGTLGTTMTFTLPDCGVVNGGKAWQPIRFQVENGNPIVVNTSNSQNIAHDGVTKTSIAINTSYDYAELKCNGSYWMIGSASDKVMADNGFGVRSSWTPVLKFGSNTQTATNTGSYSVSASKLVVAEFTLSLTTKVGTGAATVTGLPVAAAGTGQVLCYYSAGMSSVANTIVGYVQSSTVTFATQAATGVNGLTDANFTTSGNSLKCTATYLAA